MKRLVIVVLLAACHHAAPVAREVRAPEQAPRVTPPLTPDVALQTIQTSYLGSMQRCYRARLKRDAAARGRVVVTFTVDESGKLAYRQARGVGRSLEACVEQAMARWSFPKPSETVTFRLAFRLSSST